MITSKDYLHFFVGGLLKVTDRELLELLVSKVTTIEESQKSLEEGQNEKTCIKAGGY